MSPTSVIPLFQTADQVVEFLRGSDIDVLDVRFCDLPGVMQHLTMPAAGITADLLNEGIAFDGSSIRGFQGIHESDMLLLPDLATAQVDPFRRRRTLIMNFFVHDPVTRRPYTRDPRGVARKAEDHLVASGIADTVRFGAEPEFYIFDDIRYESAVNGTFYHVDSESGSWNSGRKQSGQQRGGAVRPGGGHRRMAADDHHGDLRTQMVSHLTSAGFHVERTHHGVGTGGQAGINYRSNTLLRAADDLMMFKYIVKNTAWLAGKSATFMPKPLLGDDGSGMHCHQSLWAGHTPLFHDSADEAGLSQIARYYIGGILQHAPSVMAFTNPTVNSYHRLVPGFEAPVNLVYSARHRSAAIRIPITGPSASTKRIEFRCPDPSANPYLAFAAQLMAGLDGIRKCIEPPSPWEQGRYAPVREGTVTRTPATLDDAIAGLESDHDFLLAGEVFTPDLIDTWIRIKRADEIEPIRLRPHPYEFTLYYDL